MNRSGREETGGRKSKYDVCMPSIESSHMNQPEVTRESTRLSQGFFKRGSDEMWWVLEVLSTVLGPGGHEPYGEDEYYSQVAFKG